MGERFEWVEIIEPSRHEHMFANLKTGQCLWDPPDGVPVKPTHENQWWELFDSNTGRYYYYNATSQETVWRKPKDGDIIPLSKLQMLKTRESSVREPNPNLNYLKSNINIDNNNIQNINPDAINVYDNKLDASAADPLFLVSVRNDNENAVRRNVERSSSLKNLDRHSVPCGSSERKPVHSTASFSESSASFLNTQNGKRSVLPRTHTVSHGHDHRPAIKEKPKYSSLRSKAPPKPPRMTVNVTDPRSYCNIDISVAKTVVSDEMPARIPKENNLSSSVQVSVKKSPKMTHKSIEKPKSAPPSAPIAISTPIMVASTIDDTIMTITTRNSFSDDKLPGRSSSCSPKHINEYTQDVQSPREMTFSSFSLTEVNDSLESTNISNSSDYLGDYAVPIKTCVSQSTVISQPPAYATPLKSTQKSTERTDLQTSTQVNKYDTPIPIISDNQNAQVPCNSIVTISPTPMDEDSFGISDSVMRKHVQPNVAVIPPTPTSTDVSKNKFSVENTSSRMKSSKSHANYAMLTSIESMQEKELPAKVPQSPEFPLNTIPIAPPLPKVMFRKNLPSMYDNVDPVIYDNSSDNDDLNETYNSTPPHGSNVSGSSDEAFDPSESNLLGNESPDGNYYVDGMERRSCATLPSPRSSPRKLPKTPMGDGHTTPPTKRNPLVRMKSDPLVDVEKRAKISKTIESIQSTFRPISMLNLSSNISSITNKHKRSVLGNSESDIPEHPPLSTLSTHRTGFLRRRMSIHSMLSWSKSCIKKPMVLTRDKSQRKEAVDVFKLILMCMGDKSTRKNHDTICVDIVTKGWTTPQLRDEIYIQLCKQTTGNKKINSLRKGWELITACLSIFPPSSKFQSYLEGYISRNLDADDEHIIEANVPQYAKYCYKQLERICQTGAKRGLKGPTIEEINAAINRVFNPSMFGNTLDDVMEMQRDRFPDNRLPWILTTLTESVLLQNGLQTEGIFRVPGDIDDVNQLKLMIDNWKAPEHKSDPTVPASLLKLWFRDLYEPLIPQRYYDQCIHNCDNSEISLNIIASLPPLNRLIFSYLIRLLQAFIIPENVKKSKMDENNLAMVWAPNCLRCPSDDPREIFENTRKEMTFLRNVLKVLDTSFLEGVV